MEDDDALNRFLAGPAWTAMQDYANNLGPAMLKHSLGSGILVECSRKIDADWDTVEIVVVDTIEFRISGPVPQENVHSAAPDRRARRAQRARGERERRKRNVRH